MGFVFKICFLLHSKTVPDFNILTSLNIFRIEPKSFNIDLISKTPVPITEGGDFLYGRLYFVSGSHLYSYNLSGK